MVKINKNATGLPKIVNIINKFVIHCVSIRFAVNPINKALTSVNKSVKTAKNLRCKYSPDPAQSHPIRL